jgi:N-methylhydantoinase B/oxoprolinase/acetone carboxylase alpha subunit
MQVYRYNTANRADRKFNTTGIEKNPNAVKFYAKSIEEAQNYRYIYNEDGDIIAECTLEVATVDGNFFDMAANFSSLNTYKKYVASIIEPQMIDYRNFLANATTAKARKMWEKNIAELEQSGIADINRTLAAMEYQQLSDYDLQNDLIAELRALGFDGYTTKNEVAIF